MPREYGQFCPVARTLEVLGDRWTLLIVRDLLQKKQTMKFKEMQESLDGIPTNVLSERLKHLEINGIIERVFYSDHPPRAEYRLTNIGKELRYVVGSMSSWGSKHLFDKPSFQLTHTECDGDVSPVYYCSKCETTVRPNTVTVTRLTDEDQENRISVDLITTDSGR